MAAGFSQGGDSARWKKENIMSQSSSFDSGVRTHTEQGGASLTEKAKNVAGSVSERGARRLPRWPTRLTIRLLNGAHPRQDIYGRAQALLRITPQPLAARPRRRWKTRPT